MSLPDFPQTFPVLRTKRLTLRQITREDTEAVFANFSDPEVAKWFFDEPLTELSQTDEFIDRFQNAFSNSSGITWAITDSGEGTFLGTCGFDRITEDALGELGFDLAKAHWGKGLMGETIAAILEYGFNVLGLVRVEADTYSHNTRARKLLESSGFTLERVDHDSHYYSMAPDQFTNLSPTAISPRWN